MNDKEDDARLIEALTQQQKALLTLGDQLADWINLAGPALKDLLDAYERRIRSLCTPEQLEKRPWECWEFIKARRVLDAKPVAVVDLALPLVNGGASTTASGTPIESEFEVYCNGEFAAGAIGPREQAWAEAMHYVSQYARDGEIRVMEVTRKYVSFPSADEVDGTAPETSTRSADE